MFSFSVFGGEAKEDEVIPVIFCKEKIKGQRDMGLKYYPEEVIPAHTDFEETLVAFFGKEDWKCMLDETYKCLSHEMKDGQLKSIQ